jgi:hypothetical protein
MLCGESRQILLPCQRLSGGDRAPSRRLQLSACPFQYLVNVRLQLQTTGVISTLFHANDALISPTNTQEGLHGAERGRPEHRRGWDGRGQRWRGPRWRGPRWRGRRGSGYDLAAEVLKRLAESGAVRLQLEAKLQQATWVGPTD